MTNKKRQTPHANREWKNNLTLDLLSLSYIQKLYV